MGTNCSPREQFVPIGRANADNSGIPRPKMCLGSAVELLGRTVRGTPATSAAAPGGRKPTPQSRFFFLGAASDVAGVPRTVRPSSSTALLPPFPPSHTFSPSRQARLAPAAGRRGPAAPRRLPAARRRPRRPAVAPPVGGRLRPRRRHRQRHDGELFASLLRIEIFPFAKVSLLPAGDGRRPSHRRRRRRRREGPPGGRAPPARGGDGAHRRGEETPIVNNKGARARGWGGLLGTGSLRRAASPGPRKPPQPRALAP